MDLRPRRPSGRRPLSWRWPLALPVALATVVFACTSSSSSTFRLTAERVLGRLPVPAGNPQTPEKVELGRLLFFDSRLSAGNTMACATCHDPAKGWADGLATAAAAARWNATPPVCSTAAMKSSRPGTDSPPAWRNTTVRL